MSSSRFENSSFPVYNTIQYNTIHFTVKNRTLKVNSDCLLRNHLTCVYARHLSSEFGFIVHVYSGVKKRGGEREE